ncbi:MAG: GNAT family N-acetyltransferase [Promethearchaeota archaeon]
MLPNIDLIEEINDNNLYLRKISKDDISFFFKSLKIKEITDYLSLGPLYSLDHAKRIVKNYLKYWDSYIQFNYIIELREINEPLKIGSVSLWNISWQHKRAEVGVWLIPNYWEKGFGKKTLNLIKIIAFFHLKLNRIQAHIALENVRSISTFKSSGFIEEGQLKEYLNLNSKFYDAIILACLKKS